MGVLTTEDFRELEKLFATKGDLVAMEKRQDAKYATKADLVAMEKRQDAKYAAKDELNHSVAVLEKKIDRTEQRLSDQIRGSEERITTAVSSALGNFTPRT